MCRDTHMERRSFILLAGGSFIPMTGCISRSEGDAPATDTRQASPTTAPSLPPTATPPSSSPTTRPNEAERSEKETTDGSTAETRTTPTPTTVIKDPTASVPNRLEIQYSGTKPTELRVVLIDLESKKKVYTQQHALNDHETIDLSDRITDGHGYTVVLEMDGERIYNRNMYDYENFVLSVAPDGTVRMKEHVAV